MQRKFLNKKFNKNKHNFCQARYGFSFTLYLYRWEKYIHHFDWVKLVTSLVMLNLSMITWVSECRDYCNLAISKIVVSFTLAELCCRVPYSCFLVIYDHEHSWLCKNMTRNCDVRNDLEPRCIIFYILEIRL